MVCGINLVESVVCGITRMLGLFIPIASVMPFIGSRNFRNYCNPEEPVYTGDYGKTSRVTKDTIKVITFNIKYAEKIDQAIKELGKTEDLQDADLMLLQEMDTKGTKTIAQKLNYNYIFYPASVHSKNNRDFGNAILSKWPITDCWKVLLPHPSPLSGQRRIAATAKIKINKLEVFAYSVHTETVLLNHKKRISQADSIVTNVPHESKHVIVGGDFNTECDHSVNATERIFAQSGFSRPSKNVGRTAKVFGGLIPRQMDHIFTKGMTLFASGKLENTLASDHRPVWVELKIDS